jgi:rRNA maturation endonuclease Nob1
MRGASAFSNLSIASAINRKSFSRPPRSSLHPGDPETSATTLQGRAVSICSQTSCRVFALHHQGDDESGSSSADAYNRSQLDTAVNNLIREAQIRAAFETTDDETRIAFVGTTLLAQLVAELTQRAMRIEHIGTCAECGAPFPFGPQRKYCADCGLRVAQRDASRKYRKLKREQARANESDS